MFKKSNNSGWILCPSKSYPGKFYYFNVLNGEAAWCLNENEKKVLKKEVTIQKVKANHLYPEPITPPDYPSPRAANNHSIIRTCLPTFGQAVFPNYISINKEDMANLCTPIQMLQQINQSTQTEQDSINVHSHTIPLSKRFENNINENFVSINYVAATQPEDWWNSTNICSNIGKHSEATDMQYKQKLFTKSLLKQSKLKKLQYTNKKYVYDIHAKQDSNQNHCNKFKNPTTTNNTLINTDINDLRHVLRARRRRAVDIQNLNSKVNKEYSTLNNTNKETFNIHNNALHSQEKYIDKDTTYIYNENHQTSEWYLVVDLDVLLEEYDFINRYIDKDKNCRLHIPCVILNQLKNISMGEHGGRSRVIVARQLLRKLESVTPRLNLLENKEDTKINQIINCCLEIIKRNYDVVLVTNELELIQTAKLHKIQAYHINDLKSNDIENNFINKYNKHNLFLQNTADFDPFILSKTVRVTDLSRRNVSGASKSLINDDMAVNGNITDINLHFSKLNINDRILNIKRNIKNNLFENKIIRTNDNVNCNFKTLFHNISINKTVQRNSSENINDRLLNEKRISNITFNTNKEHMKNNLEHNLIPLNEVFGNDKAPNNIFEDMLKKFHITNSVMENNLYVRFDEWVCIYEQIIEDFLYIILQEKSQQINQPSPWFLHEGMECLKDIYRENEYIISIIDKLLYYYDYSSQSGTNIKPYNFMKLFGCGFYLVEALEKTSPLLISDIKKKLIYLRDVLECPVEDLFLDTPVCNNTEDEQTCRYNFVKNPSDVLDYLKKHFSEWKNYNEDYDNVNQFEQEGHKDHTKVLRTFGRHLNKYSINKSKCISYVKQTNKQTLKNDFESTDYPKVIRNIKLLDTYEEKIKRNKIGLDRLEEAEIISSISFVRDESKAIINNRVAETNDFEMVSVNNDSRNNDFSINDNDSTKDSGFGSNSLLAYSLVRIFLSELSSSFKIIHTFIGESIKDYSGDIAEENKKNLYEKANKTHAHVTDIIDKLKIIIRRESVESSTLKSLLIKAGRDDKRTTRYRPVVMKCLEQATILEKSLKLMLSVTNEEVLSVSSKENLHFINIFE